MTCLDSDSGGGPVAVMRYVPAGSFNETGVERSVGNGSASPFSAWIAVIVPLGVASTTTDPSAAGPVLKSTLKIRTARSAAPAPTITRLLVASFLDTRAVPVAGCRAIAFGAAD